MNYKKQLFSQYRKQCILAHEANVQPDPLELGGQVTISFTWTKDEHTKNTYECMVVVYHRKPLVQRISSSHIFTTEALYRLVCEAEKYALSQANV